MNRRSLSHKSDQVLERDLATLVARDREMTANLLAHVVEVDRRKLYRPAGYPSLFAYCVGKYGMSEDMAFKRIRVARASRKFHAVLDAVEAGRLQLTGAALLAPHLTRENTDDLLGAAAGKTTERIRKLLAVRFPQRDLPTRVRALASTCSSQLVSKPVVPVEALASATPLELSAPQLAPEVMTPLRSRLAPLSPDRYALQVTVDAETYEQLRYAQALLGHAVPTGDVAEVLRRALKELVHRLEQNKFAKCVRPGRGRTSNDPRHIPAAVRRQVWQRDEGRCTFVSEAGHRCESRARLEFDHVEPLARGGLTSISGLRLRCHAHNQYEAERAFGEGFMRTRRERARQRAAERANATQCASREQAAQAEVIPYLRKLGFSAIDARRGAANCAHLATAPLEQRVRAALQCLAPPSARRDST